MDYVGVDYCVDLDCSSCSHATRISYSRLLKLVAAGTQVRCGFCGRATNHGWGTLSQARRLFSEYFAAANPGLLAS
jgi:transcription elongation factor Elf1